MATGADAVALAEKYIGVKESPRNSNRQMFGEWFGMNGQPWCAMFCSYVLSNCGVPTREAGVYEWMRKAKAAGQWVTKDPRIGDLAVFSYGNGHIGIVTRTPYRKGFVTYIDTIEGNTSAFGSQSNGGEVMRKARLVNSSLLGYIRPGYSATATPAAPTPGGLPVVADIIPNIVDSCPAPEGGVWTLARDGGVACSQGAPMFGSYPGLKAKYRTAERYFVSIHARGKSNSDGYKIISNGGEAYDFHPGMQGDLGA